MKDLNSGTMASSSPAARMLKAGLLAVFTVHMVIAGLWFTLNAWELEDRVQQRVDAVIELTEQVVITAQAGARQDMSSRVAAALTNLEQVESLSITARDGSIHFYSQNQAPLPAAPAWLSRWISDEARATSRQLQLPNTTVAIDLRISASQYLDDFWRALRQQLLMLCTSALLVCALLWLAIRKTFAPVQNVFSATQALAQGDSNVRLPEIKDAELALTHSAFNQIAQHTLHLKEDLNRELSTLQALAGAAPVGIVQLKIDQDICQVNPAMQAFAGVDGDQVSVQTLLDNLHPEDKSKVPVNWREYLKQHQSAHLVHRLLDRNGMYRWVKTAVANIDGVEQSSGRLIAFVTDISHEVNLKQNFEQSSGFYQTLSEINSAMVSATDRQQLFSVVNQILLRSVGFSAVGISIPGTRPEHYRCELFYSSTGDGVSVEQTTLNYLREQYPLGCLNAAVFASGQAQVDNDCEQPVDAITDHTPDQQHPLAGVCSLFAVPIFCYGEVVAVLSVASDQRHYFSVDIQQYVETIGVNISNALDNLERQHVLQTTLALAEQSGRQLATTLRSIGDAVLVTDERGHITMMNPAAEKLSGWLEERAQGRHAGEVLHWLADGQVAVNSVVDAVIEQGCAVSNHEHKFLLDSDGMQRAIAQTGAPIRAADSERVSGVVLVIRDQSDDLKVQQALREGENRYATLIETLPVGVFVFEPRTKQFFINSELRRILKLWKRQVTIHDVENLVHPADVYALRHYFQLAKDRGETVITDYYRYRCDDGTVIWAKMRLTPTLDENGRVVSMVGGVLDVTAERDHLNKIQTLSTMYATLSRINYLVVTAQSEESLLTAVAETIAQVPGFDQVSFYGADETNFDGRLDFGFLGLEADGSLAYGSDSDLILMVENRMRQLADQGQDKCAVVNDCLSDPILDEVIKDFCLSRDINAALSLPLTKSNKPFGSILILSKRPDIFNQQVQELVEEISDVVSFSLTQLHNDQQKRIAERELTRNEERLRLGLSVTHTGMFEINFLTGKVILDDLSRRLSGIQDDTGECSINSFFRALPLELKEGIEATVAAPVTSATAQNTFSLDARINEPQGAHYWLRVYGAITAERTPMGEPVRLLGFISDITHLKEQEDKEYLAATVFDKSSESILILGENRKIIMANQAFCDAYGYDVDEVIDQSSDIFRSDQHDDAFYQNVDTSLEQTGSWHGEWWRKRKGGQEYPALAVISAVSDSSGAQTHLVIQEMDISHQKEAEQRISNLAYHDALTNLPNRSLLRDRVEQAIAVAEREHETLSLLFLDLDHFKNINDSLGHAVGDLLLQELAKRLLKSVRKSDTVGRLGGDEFMMLLPDANADDAAHVAQKVLEECIEPFLLNNHKLAVTPSIGIAMFPRDGTDYDELLKKADTAMYRAKDEGRNGYRFFTPEMNQAVFQRMILESSLRNAVERQEFSLHYQPKYAIDGRRLVGVEALIRWNQPEMGMVSPAQFIPVAEDSGLITEIGEWVMLEACRQIKAWRDSGLPTIKVSINVSTRQFKTRAVGQSVLAALQAHELTGDCLEIEITESLLAQDMENTLSALNALKQHGVDISVDDFGTGYSSLSYLKRFPIDRLKIDQSFVRDLERDADDRAIASAVITMGHSLGIRVIAEGVETEQQMMILKEMQCDELQGYYLGRPMDAAEMTIVIERYQASLRANCIAIK